MVSLFITSHIKYTHAAFTGREILKSSLSSQAVGSNHLSNLRAKAQTAKRPNFSSDAQVPLQQILKIFFFLVQLNLAYSRTGHKILK